MLNNKKNLYYGLFVMYLLLCGYAFYVNTIKGYEYAYSMTFVSLALVFVVPVAFKLLKLKPIYELYILALIFIFMASLCGSSFIFYKTVPYWDKYTHAYSGVLGALAAYILYCSLKKVLVVERKEHTIMYLFVNAINISIACIWELYEFSILVLFDNDSIKHYSTGVYDAMGDIIVCIIGGLFTTFLIYRRYKTNKDSFITNIYEKFYQLNMK